MQRMVNEGKICFIVHSELEPPAVYVSLARGSEDAQALLEEAAAVAERTIKERYACMQSIEGKNYLISLIVENGQILKRKKWKILIL